MLSFIKQKIGLFILLGCCVISTAVQASKEDSVVEFLKKQDVIRVLADGGMGFGDLASEANVMVQLRQLGFQGRFDVVYGGKNKVRQLFGLPDNLPDVYEDKKNKTRFIYIVEFIHEIQNNSVEPVIFSASTMVSSNACHVVLNEDPNNEYAKKMQGTLACVNPANFLNTKIYFDLDNWPATKIKYVEEYGTHYYLFNDAIKHPFDDSKTFFATKTANLADAENYLMTDPNGQALVSKKPALKTFVDGIQDKTIDVLPIYGRSISGKQIGDPNYPRNMLQIIMSARHAQLNGPAILHNKPLVIAVFYDYENEAQLINQLINHDDWGIYDQPGADQARLAIKKLTLKNVFTTASLTNIDTVNIIKTLKPGDILLLSVGPLPKVVFDGIFTHTDENVWPQVREGGGSFSSLLLTGKPHFRCGSSLIANEGGLWEMNLDSIRDSNLQARMKNLYSVSDGFCEDQTPAWQQQGNLYQSMGQFMIDAHDANSAFSQYFQMIKAEAEKPENNREYQAVKKAMELQ